MCLCSPGAGKCEFCKQWSSLIKLNEIASNTLRNSSMALVNLWNAFQQRSDSHRGSSACHQHLNEQQKSLCSCNASGKVNFGSMGMDCYHQHLPGAIDLLPRVYQLQLLLWQQQLQSFSAPLQA